MWETKTKKDIGSPIGRVTVKDVGFNEYSYNQKNDKAVNILSEILYLKHIMMCNVE